MNIKERAQWNVGTLPTRSPSQPEPEDLPPSSGWNISQVTTIPRNLIAKNTNRPYPHTTPCPPTVLPSKYQYRTVLMYFMIPDKPEIPYRINLRPPYEAVGSGSILRGTISIISHRGLPVTNPHFCTLEREFRLRVYIRSKPESL